ncbi:hypothetical protein C8R44DRAFT_870516 [Mycena epipterygia]|nr:hypothetical protein C8R44DRAFT_870516 [Mycena epipterygia]
MAHRSILRTRSWRGTVLTPSSSLRMLAIHDFEPLVDHAPSLYEPSAIFCSSRPHLALARPFLAVRRILLRPFRLERERFRSQAFRSARSAHALQAFTQLVDPAASFPPRAAIPTPADPDTCSAAARTFAVRVGRCAGSCAAH